MWESYLLFVGGKGYVYVAMYMRAICDMALGSNTFSLDGYLKIRVWPGSGDIPLCWD